MHSDFLRRPGRGFTGFTLIELMVVVAILGVLGLVVATNVLPYIMESRQTVARANIATLKATVQKFRLDNHRLPDNLEELLEENPRTGQKYLENDDALYDPWDHPLVYMVESSGVFEIKSLGADGIEGGDGENADISSKDSRHAQAEE